MKRNKLDGSGKLVVLDGERKIEKGRMRREDGDC